MPQLTEVQQEAAKADWKVPEWVEEGDEYMALVVKRMLTKEKFSPSYSHRKLQAK
ncbi:hypothetical protein GGI21_003321, partial [Coemansia aciculifera]